jgi:hypothetical protein
VTFNPDFNELLSAFQEHGVKYLIVGGYAVSFHAEPRATKDLDLFIRADSENGLAVYRALARFGAPVGGVTPDDFIRPNSFFRVGAPPVMVEILPTIDGIEFDAAWDKRVEVVVDPQKGLKAFVISRHDLIKAKLATGRPQDLADVDALHRAERIKSGTSE